uniref:Uncharacterized protein n=1 Tax=Chlamydomonas leiostraca TaxID=1034604 RepID=A0A7S0R619_9CHLO|mmetsp:Transcript_14705/g.36646  ORF Transcript_14705/g.36646 Transcript_14705/m.36646 type:complete len:120 (+) Transcript_14705:647-1006(+)
MEPHTRTVAREAQHGEGATWQVHHHLNQYGISTGDKLGRHDGQSAEGAWKQWALGTLQQSSAVRSLLLHRSRCMLVAVSRQAWQWPLQQLQGMAAVHHGCRLWSGLVRRMCWLPAAVLL